MEQTKPTTRAEEIAAEGPYKVEARESEPHNQHFFRAAGPHFIGGWLTKPEADYLCRHLNAAYKQGQQDRWIPVSDESSLPPIHEDPFTEDGFVLILFQCADWPGKYKTAKASRTIGDWAEDGTPLWFWSDEEGEIIEDDDNLITHWCEIPSPPNPEQR